MCVRVCVKGDRFTCILERWYKSQKSQTWFLIWPPTGIIQWTKIANKVIEKYNMQTRKDIDLTTCKNKCIALASCASLDYSTVTTICYISAVSPMEKDAIDKQGVHVYFYCERWQNEGKLTMPPTNHKREKIIALPNSKCGSPYLQTTSFYNWG